MLPEIKWSYWRYLSSEKSFEFKKEIKNQEDDIFQKLWLSLKKIFKKGRK